MSNIYSKYGLSPVINASGRMTILGVSTASPAVCRALAEAASNFVVVEELMQAAGKKLGAMIGAEDVCITSSASSGIALAVSSLICKDSLEKAQHLYDMLPQTPRREVILLRGHNIDFGAPVSEMIQVGGGIVIEAGYANKSTLGDIRASVNDNTLAIIYIKSHHSIQKNMVDAKSVIELANSLSIPCIVDAAAEENLSIYNRWGADFVCYSGSKAIEGPTSGFVVCKTSKLADNMRLQYKGIGRVMKVGKENIMGLLVAVQEYLAGEHRPAVSLPELEAFAANVDTIPGCSTLIEPDEAGRAIHRCRIDINDKEFGMSAVSVTDALKRGSPAIYTRDYHANEGSISIDPRPLLSALELDTIFERLQELGKGVSK